MRSSSRPLPNRLSTFFTAGGGPLLFPEGSICTAGALQLRSTYLSQKARACPLSQASPLLWVGHSSVGVEADSGWQNRARQLWQTVAESGKVVVARNFGRP